MAQESGAADLAEAAANAAQTELDNANASATAVVETAIQQVNEAQETAEDIARAAMATELGQRVNALDERTTQWQRTAEQQMATYQETTATALSGITEILGRLTAPAPSSSTPATSGDQQPDAPAAPPITPQPDQPADGAGDRPAADQPAQPEKRKKRFI